MIETTILDYLNSVQDLDVPVYMEVPKNPPANFYLLDKTGSTLTNHIYRSTFAIQSYAPSLYEAAEANEVIKDLMLDGLLEEPEIASVTLNSDYDYSDTQSKRYRYQAVFDIVHY